MSVGRTVSVTTPNTGPESSAGSIWNVVAPVTVSPAAMAAWTGAAPRQAGSSEKWRLTQPCLGTASSRSLSRAPYATTAQHSGASSVSSPMNSSEFGLPGRSTGMSCSSANRATGDGDGLPRRPDAASGRVRTAATSWRGDSTSFCSEGTAGSGVPAKTRRTASV